MSDLQERLLEALAAPWGIPSGQGSDAIKRIWPIIEAELQKRDRLRDQINDAYVRTEASLTGANKLLEQTIEVLEGFEKVATPDLPLPRIVITWWRAKARPHLTKLKER